MNKNYQSALANGGFINAENLFGEAAETDSKIEPGVLCVNESKVTVVAGDPPQAKFETTTDKMSRIKVKKGLFKGAVSFEAEGESYSFTVKGGKEMLKFFEIVEQYHSVRNEQQQMWPYMQKEIDSIIDKNNNEWKE